jgi:pullulanase
MLTINVKQIALFSILSTGIVSCGGGGGGGDSTPPVTPPTNTAPTVNTLTSAMEQLEVTYAWSVSDADNDALSCVLNPGDGSDSVSIDDCKATTSTVITYSAAGTYTANLKVTDPSNATADKD